MVVVVGEGGGSSVLDPDIRIRLRIEQSGFAFRPVCVLG